MKKQRDEVIGQVAVDSGLLWVGDPSYILHKEGDNFPTIGKDWDEFTTKIKGNSTSFGFREGEEGGFMGTCIPTSYGDGLYDLVACYDKDGDLEFISICFVNSPGYQLKKLLRSTKTI